MTESTVRNPPEPDVVWKFRSGEHMATFVINVKLLERQARIRELNDRLRSVWR